MKLAAVNFDVISSVSIAFFGCERLRWKKLVGIFTGIMIHQSVSGGTGQVPGSSLIMFQASEKITPFAPVMMEKLSRLKALNANSQKMIEKIRNVAQTNPLYRGERLVASAVNAISDRQQMAVALKDASLACFDNIRPLCEYSDEMANANHAITGYEDVFLRQVIIFCVKPLQEYVKTTFPGITKAFEELEKRRDRYDNARHKKSEKTQMLQAQLMEQSATLETHFAAIPEFQMMFAKCVDVYVRAECQFFKETKSVIDAVRGPDHKKRWST